MHPIFTETIIISITWPLARRTKKRSTNLKKNIPKNGYGAAKRDWNEKKQAKRSVAPSS